MADVMGWVKAHPTEAAACGIGALLLLVGLIMMSGGSSTDGTAQIYSSYLQSQSQAQQDQAQLQLAQIQQEPALQSAQLQGQELNDELSYQNNALSAGTSEQNNELSAQLGALEMQYSNEGSTESDQLQEQLALASIGSNENADNNTTALQEALDGYNSQYSQLALSLPYQLSGLTTNDNDSLAGLEDQLGVQSQLYSELYGDTGITNILGGVGGLLGGSGGLLGAVGGFL